MLALSVQEFKIPDKCAKRSDGKSRWHARTDGKCKQDMVKSRIKKKYKRSKTQNEKCL